MASVRFDDVSKVFDGNVTAVDDLNLDIPDKEFMVLLGPSGCGKTTALRMIAGLESVTSGTVRIGEQVMNDVEPKDRDIAMVFQSYALYPHMTVRRNIESPLRARRGEITQTDRDERVAEAARILGLDELLDRKPAELSGGQRQRVALGRAIVRRPKAFLMDEPLSNLDAKLRGQTRIELVELYRRLESTFIYVTHDQIEAMTMATRIAVMEAGRLQQTGTPRDVYNQPANLFVARFIGSPPMTTFDAVYRAGALHLDERTALPFSTSQQVADGEAVMAGVRPEHIDVVGPTEGVAAEVRAAEWLGHEKHIVADIAGRLVMVREPGEGTVGIGDVIALRLRPDKVHLFSPDTGARLP